MAAKTLSAALACLKGARARDGRPGEEAACAYLEERGFEVVERNFRCRWGEIDVVARDEDATVFVEVRLRSDARHGGARESITPAKRRRIVRAARLYALNRGLGDGPFRFDVVGLDRAPDGTFRIRHDRGAFDSTAR